MAIYGLNILLNKALALSVPNKVAGDFFSLKDKKPIKSVSNRSALYSHTCKIVVISFPKTLVLALTAHTDPRE